MAVPMPTAAQVYAWLPEWQTVVQDLTTRTTPHAGPAYAEMTEFKGMAMNFKVPGYTSVWVDPQAWPEWSARNWQIPLVTVAAYLAAIPTLKWAVLKYGKWNVRNLAFYWNFGLSIFSMCGVVACASVLASELYTHGLYYTTCAPFPRYSTGPCGLFMLLFCLFSKIAELLDTILLLLAQKPVIALQWWHHSSVLLYCWHGYSLGIATGLWFAAMNYSVHATMYMYFAVMGTTWRKAVSKYAILITLAQLLQMVVGMFVTVKAVSYQTAGMECHVNKTNSVLGLLMYFSYFVLFFKLFVDNYVTKTRRRAVAAKETKKME